MRLRRIVTIVGIIAIIFVGGMIAIIVNNRAQAFSPLRTVPAVTTTVMGNGGNAVMVGDYLYFIGNFVELNSIRYRDNEHNNVRYGAIYRVRMTDDGLPSYDNSHLDRFDEFAHLGIEDLEQMFGPTLNSRIRYRQLVVPKIAGHQTSSLWVFGNHLIYTSPHNRQDRGGRLRSERIDFFRVDLNGANHRHLFTTSTGVPNITRDDFTVVWSGGRSFLLVNDGGRLVRVGVSHSAGETTTIARDVTSWAFPSVTGYVGGGNKGFNSVMQYVYWTTNRAEDDRVQSNLMYRMRISGSNRERIGQEDGYIYNVLHASGGAFVWEMGGWTPGGLVLDPVLFIAERDDRHMFDHHQVRASFQATDLLQDGEEAFFATETHSNVGLRFITVHNNVLRFYRRSAGGINNFVFDNTIASISGVDSILHITNEFIYFNSGGAVRVIDWAGQEVANFGMRVAAVDEINVSVFSTLRDNGNRINDGEMLFYMRRLTATDGDGQESVTVPVMVDRNGRTWFLATVEERFLI